MHSAYLYFAHDRLSPAELTAACIDGHLVELGEGYIPADAIETAGLRAASIRPLLGELLAATHLSAAWIHGALGEPPAPHTVQRAVGRRIHHVIDRRLVYRDTCIDERDLVRMGDMPVTSAARTLADIARQSIGDRSPVVREALLTLASRPGAPRDAIIVLARQDPVPGKPKALRLLRELERRSDPVQDDVTR